MKNNNFKNYLPVLALVLTGTALVGLHFTIINSDSYKKLSDDGKTDVFYTTTTTTTTTGIFRDIPNNFQYNKSLQFVKSGQIMKGYNDGTFKPLNPINRAEFVKTLGSANNGLNVGGQTNCFNDVHSEWFAPFVCSAKQEGWVKGYGDNSFHPSSSITYSEALIVFKRIYKTPATTILSKTEEYIPPPFTNPANALATSLNPFAVLESKNPTDPITRIDVANTIYLLEGDTQTDDEFTDEITCDFNEYKGDTAAEEVAKKFPPKDTYEINRNGMVMMNQDDFGKQSCVPTSTAVSFTWLQSTGINGLVPNLNSGSPDYEGMMDELKRDMDWTEEHGTNSAKGVTGTAKYLKDHGLADKFTIEFITIAPKNKGFQEHDDLEGKTSLDGVGFKMERRHPTGADIVNEMKKGQDVIISLRSHVLEISGIDEKTNANGNYDVKIADTALGIELGAEITPNGRLSIGGKESGIHELIAVSPKKTDPK